MRLIRRLGRTFAKAAMSWVSEGAVSMAAAVAFFSAFALAPTLVIVVAVAGAVFGPDAVRGELVEELRGLLGEDGARVAQGMIENAWLAEASGLKAALSIGTLLVGASAIFSELSEDVNRLWKVPPRPGASPIGVFLRVRLLSVGLVIGIGFLMIVFLVLDAAVKALQDAMWPPDETVRTTIALINQGSSLALLVGVFMLLMKALPQQRVAWRDVALGSVVGASLFIVGKNLFGLYLARAGTADAFGAAGSLAVLLMWLFYSASVFLYGVVFARHWAE